LRTHVSLHVPSATLFRSVLFSLLAIVYRGVNPDHAQFVFPTAGAVVMPHNLMSVLFQSTIAILILVGFESATAFGAEAKNPQKRSEEHTSELQSPYDLVC